MSKSKLGSGKRFAAVVKEVEKSGKSEESAKAIAAAAGRQKYGAKKMGQMAKRGTGEEGLVVDQLEPDILRTEQSQLDNARRANFRNFDCGSYDFSVPTNRRVWVDIKRRSAINRNATYFLSHAR